MGLLIFFLDIVPLIVTLPPDCSLVSWFGEELPEGLGCHGPRRLLAVGPPAEVGVSHLGQSGQQLLLLVGELELDRDGPSVVNKVFGHFAFPDSLSYLIQ